MAAQTQDAYALLQKFKQAFDANKLSDAQAALQKLKIAMLTFKGGNQQETQKQLLIARETLELAVYLSVKLKDQQAFARHVSQLRTYYTDVSSMLPESERQWPIMGLNLVYLLANNRIGEFHTELEAIPVKQHTNQYIEFPIQLERSWMAGSYNKVLSAAKAAPSPYYSFFLDVMVETVREKAADSAQKAYESLSLADLCQLLRLDTTTAAIEFAKKRKWEVRGDTVLLAQTSKQKSLEIPAYRLIDQSLQYAAELDKII